MKIDRMVSYILIVVIVVALASVIYIIIIPSSGEKFTEFYILGPDGKAGNYPTNLTVGENGTVTVGIVNHEGTSVSYELVMRSNNVIFKNKTYKLKNKEKKEIPLTFQLNQSGTRQNLEFLLYKLPNTQQPYRSLNLLINVN